MSGDFIRWKDEVHARSVVTPRELRERTIRMVAETRGDYPSEFAAIESVTRKLGIGSTERCPPSMSGRLITCKTHVTIL
jgi:hypothetical protein